MIMVVGLHVQVGGGLAQSELLRLQYGAELCAIPLFFMVSGYLMQGKCQTINIRGAKYLISLSMSLSS